MILPHINDIVATCAGHGIKTAVISPGSRSAPLTLAFNAHPDIDIKMIPDERAAGFIALGLAQQQNKPVVLVCTSGSAVYNYAPAIAEAYYQEIPLIVLSADRPPEWVDQYDGQTIQQTGIFGNHVKESYCLPTSPSDENELWHSNRIINEAVIKASTKAQGPVHINVPLREPFYPESNEEIKFEKERIIKKAETKSDLTVDEWSELAEVFDSCKRPLIVIGHNDPDSELTRSLNLLSQKVQVPIINDVIGNQHQVQGVIQKQDSFLRQSKFDQLKDLAPDLLITVGNSLISKNLKLFLRKYKPTNHWHVRETDRMNDSLMGLTKMIQLDPSEFFQGLANRASANHSAYGDPLRQIDREASKTKASALDSQASGEFAAVSQLMKVIPDGSILQLANSMAVRYANLEGLNGSRNIEVYANRGTSGIDGSNSTAVGAALERNELVTLITGDMAFLYDRNAFWHNYDLRNLRILVLNNAGGGIFRMIKGPADQKDYEELFETKHKLTAQALSNEFGFPYVACDNLTGLKNELADFYKPSESVKIIEFFSDSEDNAKFMASYRSLF